MTNNNLLFTLVYLSLTAQLVSLDANVTTNADASLIIDGLTRYEYVSDGAARTPRFVLPANLREYLQG